MNDLSSGFERNVELLKHGGEPQRIEAASWIADQGPGILSIVRNRLALERNPLCLKVLMGWVALRQQSEACPEILSLLESSEPEVAVTAALCAGKLACPGATDRFRREAERPALPLEVRLAMVRSLGFQGRAWAERDRDAVEVEETERALIRLLRLSVASLQVEAAGALVFMNARNAERALAELEFPSDPYVSYFAQRACRKLYPTGLKQNGGKSAVVEEDFGFSLPLEDVFDRKATETVLPEAADPFQRASTIWNVDRSELMGMWRAFYGTVFECSLPRYYLVLPDRDRLPIVEDWLGDPLEAPDKALELCGKFSDFFSPAASRGAVFSGEFARFARAITFPRSKGSRTEFPSHYPSRRAPMLPDLLSEVMDSSEKNVSSKSDSIKELNRLLPESLSACLGDLLASVLRLQEAWQSTLDGLSEADRIRLRRACLDWAGTQKLSGSSLNWVSKTIADLDLDGVWEAEDRLLEALARTSGVLGRYREWTPEGRPDWVWKANTPYGTVALYGNRDHRIRHAGCLIVDFGGNDEWVREEPDDGDQPMVQVYLDLSGNDSYRSTAPAGFGGAVMGTGLLLDLDGDDQYRCEGVGLGAAILGTGFLLDASGDDSYSGGRFCQGAAAYGIGILADLAGRDRYKAVAGSHGYGETRGLGGLLEFSGNDVFSLDPDASGDAKDAARDGSLGQGCGKGFRSDPGEALSGGVGLLCDLEGDDVYRAGSLAQGTGYWYAVGALVDSGGNDSYTLDNYGQGAGIHAGMGLLLDVAGSDRYLGRHHAAGCGLDRGGGILFDVAGNDEYLNESDVQGAGVKPLGFGVLVDHEGNDRYRARVGRGYCRLPDFWPSLWATGLFYDRSGTDSYEGGVDMGGNRRIRTQNRYGFGVDAE
ncbi:MAG: hypothetical protein HY788_22290 [Deltaproteobacteria bacterium]|nr:hypothetical protein [Deltaproteobacteria bacterium]